MACLSGSGSASADTDKPDVEIACTDQPDLESVVELDALKECTSATMSIFTTKSPSSAT